MAEDISYQFIEVCRRGRVTEVTINRPEVLNALHAPAHFELAAAFDDFANNDDQWVAILTGAGDKAFCAGNDLKFQAAGGSMERPASGWGGLSMRFDLTKPVIAAVNGFALGGGFELALACDLIVAAETATFALPEPRVGLAALAGGLQRLPRAIGVKRALDIVLTARRLGAQEGFELGFVNRLAPSGDAMHSARMLAEEIAALAPLSVRASKQALLRGMDALSLEDALRSQRDHPAMRDLLNSNDFIEGPLAFSEKRQPRWKGR